MRTSSESASAQDAGLGLLGFAPVGRPCGPERLGRTVRAKVGVKDDPRLRACRPPWPRQAVSQSQGWHEAAAAAGADVGPRGLNRKRF